MRWCDKSILFLFVVAILVVIKGCSTESMQIKNEKIAERILTTVEKNVINANNNFALKIFKEINKEDYDKSIFISPLSISMVLCMTLNGASESTYDSIRNTLDLTGFTEKEINESFESLYKLFTRLDPQVQFKIANSIWIKLGLPVEKEFVEVNKNIFEAEVISLNFSDPGAADIINRWVDSKTNGRIKEIVPSPIPEEVVMYLLNAIYFKGLWSNQFKKELTRDDFFILTDGTKKSCKMMSNYGKFNYFENDQFQLVDLLYGDSLFSMTILLPREKITVDELIKNLNLDVWNNLIENLAVKEGEIHMPKFTFTYKKTLNEVLKTLGMQEAFTPYNANFSRISKPENLAGKHLYITNVRHKAYIDIDEEGTEAAAVTAVEIGITSIPQIFIMRIDRPFIFAIRESCTGTILFIGKILQV